MPRVRQRDDDRGPTPVPATAEISRNMMKSIMHHDVAEFRKAQERIAEELARQKYEAERREKLRLERENAAEAERRWREDQLRAVELTHPERS